MGDLWTGMQRRYEALKRQVAWADLRHVTDEREDFEAWEDEFWAQYGKRDSRHGR